MKSASKYPYQIIATYFKSQFTAYKRFQFHQIVVKNRNRRGKATTFEQKAIDDCRL